MAPAKVATAVTHMRQAYYENDHTALRQELTNLLSDPFDISVSDADEIGELLAIAAMKFESAKSNYNTIVLPGLKLAYNTSGIESSHSTEVSHEATVGITSPSPLQEPAEDTLQSSKKGALQQNKVSYRTQR
jgi:hypothetical protein